ncbi:putative IQ motif, EF-hand binding, BAG domain, BAG domain superfamily [Helianthus annuus]|nr:putative IQ motif, EF-hand binding, BAG domain, BAG domain superfamily [Helianthus annuus]KAJ0661801.1 putative IQ motif, EF-hand binding, BAG domain, BAG domain superfamily [Helianthus annuus]
MIINYCKIYQIKVIEQKARLGSRARLSSTSEVRTCFFKCLFLGASSFKRHLVRAFSKPIASGLACLNRVCIIWQAFAKRVEKNKGKKKELSPQDAAMMIQMTFRAYLIRRSQALRALRELAIAKGKLKELRSLFNNFSYRRRVARDAEEKQRFSEKIIVLLLTVDAIEGADILVRAAKRSMVDELEAMLDVVDPQPGGGKSLSLRRRTFDMPDGVIQKEVAEGVAQVVRMIAQDDGSETFE